MSRSPGLASRSLSEKYATVSGPVYLNGTQALVRLLLMQRQHDRQAGLRTAGFVSGYRGSPLGALDTTLWRAKSQLAAHDIVFQPGLNEDLAATAVWGSQQVGLAGGATVEGVFGLWYGKGPGVDRSLDVLKHANLAGTAKLGGVLAVAGDDHACQSSTLAHQSEQTFMAAMIPVLSPASVQEYLELGLLGFALSRFSGCWVGFKAVAEVVESSATVDCDPAAVTIRVPGDFVPPADGLHLRWPDLPLQAEVRLHGAKMRAVAAFARANALDRLIIDPARPRLGIMTTGKSYLDVRQALDELGLSTQRAADLGIRLYKVGMSWPLEEEGARAFARGLEEVLVVEEKRGVIEDQLLRVLYNVPAAERPRVVGKLDERGVPLLKTVAELTTGEVVRSIGARLARMEIRADHIDRAIARLDAPSSTPAQPITLQRTPFFCSGCPHNTSTVVPEGSRAMAGIGCHGMAIYMPERRTQTITHMGGEGANWIGQAPFTKETHVFQNLGDGTYAHSGLLAIRAAIAAKVNITYKILYNDAVAMTGGQPVEGQLTVPQVSRQLAAEGASRVVILTDEPQKYADAVLPSGVSVHHRDELGRIQLELRVLPGASALIYDQTCAAEKRRRRKRGLIEDPPQRVFINKAVCEGCGDCSRQSNCVSIVPVETELGRKRRIDQSSCNKDMSCLKGFCPSFVVVRGGKVRRSRAAPTAAAFEDIPLPTPGELVRPWNILVAGIGGTGVVTIGALLGMAASLEGKGCTVLDFTGLSQKNGAVTSHVRIAPRQEDLHAVRIDTGRVDLLVGCDLLVSVGSPVLPCLGPDSHAVVNLHVAPPTGFIRNPDMDFQQDSARSLLQGAASKDGTEFIDATRLATEGLGEALGSNLLLLGFAFQRGLIPVGLEALMRAIELNGASVEMNKSAFALGRLLAWRPSALTVEPAQQVATLRTLPQIIERRVAWLTQYQDSRYAARYARVMAEVQRRAGTSGLDVSAFVKVAARSLYRLMAYKDEYEVARLYTNGEFQRELQAQFEGEYRLQFSFAPPLFARRDCASGALRKQLFGGWLLPALKVLAALRRLRGTPLDLFGYTSERRMERQLIAQYEALLLEIGGRLTSANLALAIGIAETAEQIRGFGHVKEANAAAARTKLASLLEKFNTAHEVGAAA